ncbi:MAG: hypothetical protein EBX99_02570 [Acidimicrobiia bacterium]|nr:hypothetical protein [Acidimicrobiia bacterium]
MSQQSGGTVGGRSGGSTNDRESKVRRDERMIIASTSLAPGLAVEGPDARRYLHSQLSNDIAALPVGASCYSLLLEPVGKLVSLFRVVCESEETFLIEFDGPVAADVVQATQTRLQRFLIRTKATITERTSSVTCVRSTDDGSLPDSLVSASSARPAWWCDGTAIDIVGGDAGEFGAAHAVEFVDPDRIDAERVRVGWPANGREIIVGETIPASIGIVRSTVSFTKGCYPGQELVERMDSRGSSAPRTLRMIAGTNVTAGEPIVVNGVDVGMVTSSADGCALAYVDRGTEYGMPVSEVSRASG